MKFKKADLYVLLCHSAGNEKRQVEQTLIEKYNLWKYIPKSEYEDLKNICKEIDFKFTKMLEAVLKDYHK
tara:strand:+ start:1764 stop:1973 length:210 start_codon:yes stop_codon:yes gene_type:complete